MGCFIQSCKAFSTCLVRIAEHLSFLSWCSLLLRARPACSAKSLTATVKASSILFGLSSLLAGANSGLAHGLQDVASREQQTALRQDNDLSRNGTEGTADLTTHNVPRKDKADRWQDSSRRKSPNTVPRTDKTDGRQGSSRRKSASTVPRVVRNNWQQSPRGNNTSSVSR